MDWRGCCPWKNYRLENCALKELGVAANDAYLIEGILNSKNPPCEVSEHNKHIPCGLDMKFVDGKQVSHDVVPIVYVILYVPSISSFFSYHCGKNSPS